MEDQDHRWTDWANRLSPWTLWLHDRLLLKIDAWTRRDDLDDSLWIQVDTHRSTARPFDWVKIIEAIELFDWLSYVDNRSCWDLLLHIADSDNMLRSKGCPNDFFYGLRPRYELNLKACSVPSDQIMNLIVHGTTDQDHSAEYKACDFLRPCQTTIPYSSPLRLRFFFDFSLSVFNRCQQCTDRHRTSKLATEILALATRAGANFGNKKPAVSVVAFGFSTWSIESNALRDFYRSIGRKISLFNIEIRAPTSDIGTNFYGSFLWRMLVPQSTSPCPLAVSSHPTLVFSMREETHYIATCSALAHSHNLQCYRYTLPRDAKRPELAALWIVFALFSSTATHQIDTVDLHLTNNWGHFYSALQDLIHHKNPPLHASYRRQNPPLRAIADRDATIVRVHARTKIYGAELPRSTTVKSVYHGRDHAFCHVVGRDLKSVDVLVPGVGFARILHEDVIEEFATPRRHDHPIRSLTVTYRKNDTQWIIPILKLVGGPLTTLTLTYDGTSESSSLSLRDVFGACPHLKHLKLAGQIIQPESLFPSRWGQALETLTVANCNVLLRSRRLVFFKPCITPRMVPLLHSVFIENTIGNENGLQDYLFELATARQLERLVVVRRQARTDREDTETGVVDR